MTTDLKRATGQGVAGTYAGNTPAPFRRTDGSRQAPPGLSGAPGTLGAPTGSGIGKLVDKTGAAEQQYQQMLQEFIKHYMSPIDLNDPYVKQLVQGTQTAASDEARRRGINGPLAVNGVQDATTRALVGADMQRKQMGLQGLGMGFGQYNADRNFGEQQRQFNMGYGLQRDQFDYNRQRDTRADQQDFYSTIGSVGGGILGGVGGFMIGGPMGAVGGAQLGSGLGAGLGHLAGGY